MKSLYRYFRLLLFVQATVYVSRSAEIKCTAEDQTTLKCQFPENINITKMDFGVKFYPFTGGEEPVAECTWIRSHLHCITQMGFKREGPVSDTAVITIPTRFSSRNGNFRCGAYSYPYDSIKPCQFAKGRDTQHFSACEAKLALGGRQVILECRFSSNTESFTVKYNATVSVKFTKSSCQNSTLCHYKVENNHHMFSMELNLSEYPYGEYTCHPHNSQSLSEIKGCSVAVEKHSEEQQGGAYIPLWVLIVVVAIFVLSVLVFLIMRKNVCHYFNRLSTNEIS